MPSHNGEDAKIDELLGFLEMGFYVDVGANNPYTTSNSHPFYARGWSGIDIEPIPGLADLLRQAHPRNLVVNAAAGSKTGSTTFYVHPNGELSSLDKSLVPNPAEIRQIPIMKVDDILAWANPEQIDFASIDVEGWEREVLLGFNLPRWQPKLLVIEATKPNDFDSPTWQDWQDIVLSAGYSFTYADKCNRFYLKNM